MQSKGESQPALIMKSCLSLVLTAAIALPTLSPVVAQVAENRKPIVISAPAVQNGSNASRAPFIANRPFDDAQRPNGQPIDLNVPPNTPATDPEPDPLPMPRVAILQRTPAPAMTADPGLLPTGRTTVSVTTSVDSATVLPAVRASMFESRAQTIADIESRLNTADKALASVRASSSQMSGAGRDQFKAAEDDVKAREKALRKSLRAARNASSAEWEGARNQLASDYEAYATALARIDAATGVSATR